MFFQRPDVGVSGTGRHSGEFRNAVSAADFPAQICERPAQESEAQLLEPESFQRIERLFQDGGFRSAGCAVHKEAAALPELPDHDPAFQGNSFRYNGIFRDRVHGTLPEERFGAGEGRDIADEIFPGAGDFRIIFGQMKFCGKFPGIELERNRIQNNDFTHAPPLFLSLSVKIHRVDAESRAADHCGTEINSPFRMIRSDGLSP